MPHVVLAGVLVTLILATPLSTALSQVRCDLRDVLVTELKDKYGEVRHSSGVQGRRGLTEIFASVKTGSWTILLTSPSGVSCIMAAGEAFQQDEIAVDDAET